LQEKQINNKCSDTVFSATENTSAYLKNKNTKQGTFYEKTIKMLNYDI